MSTKQALTEFHRGSILAAAGRLFAEKGTEKTTMDDIARAAEYSKATLYVYFQSKEEIINAILLNGMILLKQKLHEAIEGGGSWRRTCEALYLVLFRFCGENPLTYGVATGAMSLVQEGEIPSKGVSDILRVHREIDEELERFLTRGIAEGAVNPPFPPMETVLLFWSALAGLVRMAEVRGDYIQTAAGLNQEEFVRHGARLLLSAIGAKTEE